MTIKGYTNYSTTQPSLSMKKPFLYKLYLLYYRADKLESPEKKAKAAKVIIDKTVTLEDVRFLQGNTLQYSWKLIKQILSEPCFDE